MTRERKEELLGKVFEMKDLVEYQERTISSRMIINNRAGSITIFSFDKDEGLSEHTAPYDAVVMILDGECQVWVAGVTHTMRAGQTIIFPAHAPHAVSATSRFKMALIMIRGKEDGQ